VPVVALGALMLSVFLVVHVAKDLSADVGAWYFHSTWVWLLVMVLATGIYLREMGNLKRRGVDVDALYATLPPQ